MVADNRSGIEGTLDSVVGGSDAANWEVNVHESGAISVRISDSGASVFVTGDCDQINQFATALVAAVRTSVRLQVGG